MTVRTFSQLCEMLDSNKVKLKMSIDTHKYILSIGFTIDIKFIKDETLKNKLDGITIEHDNNSIYKTVEFVPTFTPRIGDGFTLNID